jgi:hypothetical protein
MRKHVVVALSMSLVVALVNPIIKAASVSSTFDSGTQGWMVADIYSPPIANPPQVVTYYTPVYNASGGNPGGFISMTDPSGNWFFFDAPAPFLGNQSSAFGGSLSYDMRVSASDGVPSAAVMLVGPGTTLYYTTPSPTNVFSTFTIPLAPLGWRTNDWATGPQPTDLQMQQVLGNLTALRISGDWLTGVETASLDNVVLSSGPTTIPAPGALLLVLSGLACLPVVKGRSRRGIPAQEESEYGTL